MFSNNVNIIHRGISNQTEHDKYFNKSDHFWHTVFAQIEARASIYLESSLDPAYIRDRLLFETGLCCFKEWLIKESLREAGCQSTI